MGEATPTIPSKTVRPDTLPPEMADEWWDPVFSSPAPKAPEARRHTVGRPAALVMLASAAVYCLAVGHRPFLTSPQSAYDDAHYMSQAMEILSGHWLGAYSDLTLIKGPGFPIFLAFNYLIGLPVGLALAGLYAAATAFFCHVVCQAARSELFRVLLFAALLFVPTLASVATTTIERDFFYAAIVLAFWAAAIDMAFFAPPLPRAFRSALLTGILGAWTWLTREEGVWILPALGLLAILSLVKAAPAARGPRLAGWTMALTVAILLVASYGVANRLVYGRFVVNEMTSGQFPAAVAALERASQADWRPYVPVPAKARRRIYAESPTFRSLAAILDPPASENGWATEGCRSMPQTCGDIGAGMFLWGFRSAAADIGMHASPTLAETFYRAIAAEVGDACAAGRLRCAPWLVPSVPPFTRDQARDFPETLIRAMKTVILFEQVQPGWFAPSPATGLDSRYADLLAMPGTGPGRVVTVEGSYDAATVGRLGILPGAGAGILTRPAEDDAPPEFGPAHPFSATFACVSEPCSAVLSDAHGNQAELVLSPPNAGEPMTVRLGPSALSIDRMASTSYTLTSRLTNSLNRSLPILCDAYSVFVLIGLAALALTLIVSASRRAVPIIVAVLLVLLVAVISRISLIAIVDATSFPAIFINYLAPAYPLTVAMAGLALFSIAETRWRSGHRIHASRRRLP